MSDVKAIYQLKIPNTRASLHKDFQKLGLEKGMVVIVHSSLSSLGWVCGGPVAVIQALMDTVGEEGTIIMPTQTADNSDPAEWQNPPVPEEWWPIIREETPAYDPHFTPTTGMGKIVEAFRTFPGVKRSLHPTYSFAAWGKHAEYILSEQPLEEGFGLKSPLAKIYELDGYVLLLGAQHDSNTSLHLAEHAIINRKKVQKGTALFQNNERIWKTYEEIVYDSDPFDALGKEFEETTPINSSKIGLATCKLMKQRLLVDFGREWLQKQSS
ncbi:AAC(3) family N-acetyltransferase [Bacillus sp. DTU_2020_1000418_1_SI_GHA_SEK_038]|uniref:aminoglycoside N(3)-acetyltransferase n=1 Tax=Bacillus sp. DTU_2020_1000418_1_SI_GHA_SEK_038 TaxID=3077585 RepID=UPI0028ECC884|nr:AAC(3) family N-acetyltransferase [Bacillus sp. DTU_2020_1000418_1_SI_GHA_SEK_038]WNS76276.1 AAC(3) family N-acetyltransferase [Bacillus sp. DTU_2020_1000418_1_SI_GHA_SEK_038]